ncbi:hypothetical protein ES332_A12G084000v1 [Gossypium tomentosum]|uniref:Uncharacterized protein n=1 Tax=Gossypium tomentosum TaxID=34277 RepID=A0A5D2MUA6_GOSTO|nr:hypothetical protein ES332_A12G084000v1 [Gossypium tomentosum]TYH95094.1 hypothetical protein ES332_A12G084000v1 [Gossypium tomentosum]
MELVDFICCLIRTTQGCCLHQAMKRETIVITGITAVAIHLQRSASDVLVLTLLSPLFHSCTATCGVVSRPYPRRLC